MSNELRSVSRTQSGMVTSEAPSPAPQEIQPKPAAAAGKLALMRSSLLEKVGARKLASTAPKAETPSGEQPAPRGRSWIRAQMRGKEEEQPPERSTGGGGGGINNGPPNTKDPRLASGGGGEDDGEGEEEKDAAKQHQSGARAGTSAGQTAESEGEKDAAKQHQPRAHAGSSEGQTAKGEGEKDVAKQDQPLEKDAAKRRQPLPRAGSSAGQTAKQDTNTAAFQNYVESMAKNVEGKAAFFERHLREMGDKPMTIVDLGASGGELTHTLEGNLPQHKFIMVDMNPDAMRAGGHARGRAVAADAFFLPLQNDKLDAVMMSSFLHELYSYAPTPFSREYAVQGLRETGRVLKPGGKLLIRDPARPEAPDEPMRVQPFRNNGTNPQTREALLAADPAELSSGALLERFLIEFPPAKELDPGTDLGQRENFQLPAWVTSEFIRHRVFARDINDWTSELRECYGVFTTSELTDAAQRAGFRVESVETGFNRENRSVGYGNEMRIFSASGEEVDQATRFPTQVFAVLTLDDDQAAKQDRK